MLANIYEEKGMLLDALQYYKKAAAYGTDVKDYKQALDDFIKKYNIPFVEK